MKKILIIVIDGCSLDYISEKKTPNLYRLSDEKGFFKKILSAMPSVTNVNHATILSGNFPNKHGVVGNYYYNRETGEQGFIESKGFIKIKTAIDYYKESGGKTALLTVKGKVLATFGSSVDIGISAADLDIDVKEMLSLSDPPKVGSLEANDWIFESCFKVVKEADPDFIYCTTNDYMMHNYSPETPEALSQMHMIDHWIGKIYDLNKEREIYITADHGMNKKTRVIDLQRVMDAHQFDVLCHPPLKDRYIENHLYQEGGTLYLYFKDLRQTEEVITFLEGCDFIEHIFTKEEAAKEFSLPTDNIGEYMALTKKDCAFGEIKKEELADGEYEIYTDKVRTHGSIYEREIPLITANPRRPSDCYMYNKDISRYIIEDILTN